MQMKTTILSLFFIFAISATIEVRDNKLQSSYEYVYSKVAQYKPLHADRYTDVILKNAKQYDLDERYLVEQIENESRFNWNAVSHMGARGSMQVIPKMHNKKIYAVDGGKLGKELSRRGIWNVSQMHKYYHRISYGIEMGCMHMRWLLDRFGQDYEKALAGYVHGHNSKGFKNHAKRGDFDECNYVKDILYGK